MIELCKIPAIDKHLKATPLSKSLTLKQHSDLRPEHLLIVPTLFLKSNQSSFQSIAKLRPQRINHAQPPPTCSHNTKLKIRRWTVAKTKFMIILHSLFFNLKVPSKSIAKLRPFPLKKSHPQRDSLTYMLFIFFK